MSVRHRLPNRRAHDVIDFQHGGFAYTAGIGRFANGSIAEVFLDAAKSGTVVQTWASDAAIVASIALQHGVPAETIRRALSREHDGAPASPLCAVLDMLATETTDVVAGGAA